MARKFSNLRCVVLSTLCVAMSTAISVASFKSRKQSEKEERTTVFESIMGWSRGPGKTRLCCGGRCITGPRGGYALQLWSWILGPFALWAGMVAPVLWTWSKPAVLLMPALLALTALFFLLTTCVDPGIIPRRSQLYQPAHSAAVSRWCTVCQVEKPPRAYHCSVCDNCVLQMDHHCPVVGTCIAGRNLPAFYAFNIAATTMMYFAIVTAAFVVVVKHSSQTGHGGWVGPLTLVALGIAALVLACGGVITGRWHYQCCCWPRRKATLGVPARMPSRCLGLELPCLQKPASMLAEAIAASNVGRGREPAGGGGDGGGFDEETGVVAADAVSLRALEMQGADV